MKCYGQIVGRGWIQEWYETASGDAARRVAALRKAGFKASASAMGSQVTPVGRARMSLVTIRGEDLDPAALPPVDVIRLNPRRPRRTSTRRRRRAQRVSKYARNHELTLPAGRRDLRARRLGALRRLQTAGGARRRNPLPDPILGTVLTREELERVQALLEDGFTVLLQPLADQVVIATVDLDKLTALVGDPRAALH